MLHILNKYAAGFFFTFDNFFQMLRNNPYEQNTLKLHWAITPKKAVS